MGTIEQTKLTVDDVCRILDTCAKCGVSIIAIGDLQASFGTQATGIQAAHSPPAAAMAPDYTEMSQTSLADDEQVTREEKLAMMLIEDPLALEQMMANGELDEDEQQHTDDESSEEKA